MLVVEPRDNRPRGGVMSCKGQFRIPPPEFRIYLWVLAALMWQMGDAAWEQIRRAASGSAESVPVCSGL